MNPKVPDLLSRVVDVAARTLDRPTGDPRRRDIIEKLVDEVAAAADWGTDQPPRLVNEWTKMLLTMLRVIEREGPLGDSDLIERAQAIGFILQKYVSRDLLRARELAAHPRADRPVKYAGARR